MLNIEPAFFGIGYNRIEVMQIDIFFSDIQLFEFVDDFQRTVCNKLVDRGKCTGSMLALLNP